MHERCSNVWPGIHGGHLTETANHRVVFTNKDKLGVIWESLSLEEREHGGHDASKVLGFLT